jgi:uncharacterized GH25 family protein
MQKPGLKFRLALRFGSGRSTVAVAANCVFMLTLMVCASPGVAHDFWIEPTEFNPEIGSSVDLFLRVGMDLNGDSVPYIPDWFSDYRVTDQTGARPVTGITGDDPAGRFSVKERGAHIISYRSTRDFVELDAEKFHTYLKKEGLENIIARRAESDQDSLPGREYYSRCAKSLLYAGGVGPETHHLKPIGYTLELVPERDPLSMQPGDELPVQLLYREAPLPGVLVIAFTSDKPDEKVSVRTDEEGRVRLPLAHTGLWLIKAVHMISTGADNKKADWESFWASLTLRLD